MNYLVEPQTIYDVSMEHVNGFKQMIIDEQIPKSQLLTIARTVAEHWTYSWNEDEGFGSSDRTFVVKDFIDNVIGSFVYKEYKTQFNPYLEVVND